MRYTIFILIIILMSGCSSKPSKSIYSIKEKAYSGDIQGVYSFIDKPKINDDLIKQLIKLIESDDGNKYIELNIQKIKTEADDIIKLKVWDVIDDEVKKGKDGSLANLKVVKEEQNNDFNASVLVQLENSKQTTFQLSKINNKWLITGLNLKDIAKDNVFKKPDPLKKVNAKPSFDVNKIQLIEECIPQRQEDKFLDIIKPELQKLIGVEYDRLINNMGVSFGLNKVEGHFIVHDGMVPHSGGESAGIIVIDVTTGVLSVAIKSGDKINRYSDMKDEKDYPDLIRSWRL